MTEAKRDSEELNAEEVSRMSQIGCLFSFLCIRGIHDKNVFNSQRAFSINTEVLSVTMSNQNFICVTFFFSGCKTAECHCQWHVRCSEHSADVLVDIVRGLEDDPGPCW